MVLKSSLASEEVKVLKRNDWASVSEAEEKGRTLEGGREGERKGLRPVRRMLERAWGILAMQTALLTHWATSGELQRFFVYRGLCALQPKNRAWS